MKGWFSMKKIFSVLLAVIIALSCCFVFAGAKTTYNATWTLTAKVNGTSYNSNNVISVNPGDSVKVTLHLSNNYYTGPTCFQLFYTPSIFAKASKGEFNTKGRLYSVCGKTWSTFVDWENVNDGNKNQGWPNYSADKLNDYKNTHQWLRVTMTPNVMLTSTTVGKLNEDLITITFDVSKNAKPGATGEIALPIETMRTKNYRTGYFYSSIYKTSDMTGDMLMYSDDQSFDCSKATLKFKVNTTSKTGDVNKDGKINSADALLVLQHTVGITNLSSEQQTLADVNRDSKVNSADALKILQYTVGQINKF